MIALKHSSRRIAPGVGEIGILTVNSFSDAGERIQMVESRETDRAHYECNENGHAGS